MIATALNAAGARLATTLKQVLGADQGAARTWEQPSAQVKVQTGLSNPLNLPDFSAMTFDLDAPRGTYLNILV